MTIDRYSGVIALAFHLGSWEADVTGHHDSYKICTRSIRGLQRVGDSVE